MGYRLWSGQGAAVVARAGRRLFGAVVVPLGQPTAPAMATRPAGALAKAACGLGVVWGRVSGMWMPGPRAPTFACFIHGRHSHRTAVLGVLLAGACTSMNIHMPRGTSLTCRISDPHHPTQGEGVSPQVECTHVVRLCRLRRKL